MVSLSKQGVTLSLSKWGVTLSLSKGLSAFVLSAFDRLRLTEQMSP